MTDLTIVAPFDADLMRRLRGRRAVIRVDCLDAVTRVQSTGRDCEVQIDGVWATIGLELADLDLNCSEWNGLVIIESPGSGPIRRAIWTLADVDQAHLRLILPARTSRQIVTIRALASLGYHCCILLGDDDRPEIDWDALHELAVYALFGNVPHGDIDPFSYAARRYDPTHTVDVRAAYYADPRHHLHAAQDGSLMVAGFGGEGARPLGLMIEDIDGIEDCTAYTRAVHDWKRKFEEMTRCGACPAWRVCMGALTFLEDDRCETVMAEVIDAAEIPGNNKAMTSYGDTDHQVHGTV